MTTIETLSAALGVQPWSLRERARDEFVLETEAAALPALADRIASAMGGRLMSLFATDAGGDAPRFSVHHIWSLSSPRGFLRVVAPIDGAAGTCPSIAAAHPSANWFEREVMDFFGLVPLAHPNPVRVAHHDDWPDGVWPLRKDVPGGLPVARVQGDFHPFRPVTGEGVFQVPVGPVHAGVIEPGHFRFGVAGEPVLYLQVRLFYVHKGIEKRFEGMPWRAGLFLAESISGDTSVGHPLAYAHAIERLAGVSVPPRAQALRVILLELERLYNHTADIGAIATDVAFTVPASRAQALRESLVRLNDDLFGTRLLRGTIAVGGVKCDLPPAARDRLRTHLRVFQKAFDELVRLLIDAGTFTDRVDGTGILSTQAARDLGVVGMVARASGVDADFRRDHPFDGYETLRFTVPVEEGGDVRARLMVRAREVEQSLSIVQQALDVLAGSPETLIAAVPEQLPSRSSALGWVEAWRGPITHWISTDTDGVIDRVKVTDPSFLNWPALVHAVPGNIIPDFPVINKSFNLSYSGNDR
ncbi:MAG TPA: NADH-quinone oxidoreductase subunit C [Vicinamibacterales bacterium]|nr:NADH-quinone oxidoreductase subunit C [Vicinamibacterales bacterium]